MITYEDIRTAAKIALLLTVAYSLAVISYNIVLHPLRHYPGPLVAKFTDCYAGFYALSMRLHLATYQDHKRYGSIIRHGPNRLVFNSPTALNDIYRNERVTKSYVYTLIRQPNGIPSIFGAIDRQRHAIKRKLIGRAVNDQSMRTFEPTLQEQVDVFLRILYDSSRTSSPVEMSRCCKRLGLDVVGHLAFGFDLKTQTEPTYRFMGDAIAKSGFRINMIFQLPLVQNKIFDLVLHYFSRNQRLEYNRALQHIISTRLSIEKDAKHDLYSIVADSINTGGADGIQLGELWSEAVFFFPAGGDTTSTAMSALFFYLSRNSESYDKLTREIRNTFSDVSEIRGGQKLSGCRYLRACIDEALRMSSPVSGTPWREIAKEEQANGLWIVDGHVIPPGTQVGVNIYSLHHNEEYFPKPFAFRPERWLTEDPDALRSMNNAFTPFSVGYRGCAGKAMAYLESSLVVAKTLWYFDFSKVPGDTTGAGSPGRSDGRDHQEEFQICDTFNASHDGPNLLFTPREIASKDLA
ncbi:cytochrome P450 [Xylariaceae sp. FL0255]|nr:cytochrome P450 [Xylariaceae sp. FL0255]